DDDFNTRAAIESLFGLARETNRLMGERTMTRDGALETLDFLKDIDSVLGILPDDAGRDSDDLAAVMSILIDLRKELRVRKQYDLADLIRNRLGEAGYVLEDAADGAKWKKA
ncbi:MAG: cysteine--tRNA ligase, partial [Candidatus Methanomethylophilus sp.]|nr:cysteine--tRNA ligase [Methanomethylophilus sp.]